MALLGEGLRCMIHGHNRVLEGEGTSTSVLNQAGAIRCEALALALSQYLRAI